MYSRNVIDVGIVDPNNITAIQSDLMLAYASEHGHQLSAHGAVLIPAGQNSLNFKGLNYSFTLNHPVRYCGVLNPEAILPSQQEGLKMLLARASKEKTLAAGKYIMAVTMDGKQEFQFYDLKLSVSARKKFDDIVYYDVLDVSKKSLLGSGDFGKVYVIPGTIKPRFYNPNDMFFSPGHQKRIAKIQRHYRRHNKRKKPFEMLTRAKREADLLRRSSSSVVRDLNVLHAEQEAISIISMRRYEGNDLNDVLEYEDSVRKILDYQLELQNISSKLQKCSGDPLPLLEKYTTALNYLCKKIDNWAVCRSKVHPDLRNGGLTVKDRIELSISLLREYQLEVQHKHILHRDLKLENIFLEKNGMALQPRIIDFGLSCDQSSVSQLNKTVGALLYRAPEAIDGPNTLKSDVYALMRVIAMIWRDHELYSNEKPGVLFMNFSYKRMNEKVISFDLFSGLDIDEDLKKMIENVIRSGTLWDPKLRNDIAADITAFEAIRLAFYMASVDPDARAAIADAHKKALALAEEMVMNNGYQSLDKIAKKIMEISETINHHPQAIDIFIKTLGVRALYGCRSVLEIKHEINAIQSRYHAVLDEYSSRLAVLQREAKTIGIDSYQKYLNQCRVFANKSSSQLTNLDAVKAVTNHLVEKMIKMNEAANYYQKIMDEKDVEKSANRLKK